MKFFFLAFLLSSGVFADSLLRRNAVLPERKEIASEEICLDEIFNQPWIQMHCEKQRALCCPWHFGEATSMTLTSPEVRLALEQLLHKSTAVDISGARQLELLQTHRLLSIEEIRKKIQETLAVRYSKSSPIVLTEISLIGKVLLPLKNITPSNLDFSVEIPTQLKKAMSLKIVLKDGSQANENTLGWVSAQFEAPQEVYFSRRTIKAGDSIQFSDFEKKKVDLFSMGSRDDVIINEIDLDYLTKTRKAKVNIAQNTILFIQELEPLASVRVGDPVTLILKSENLKITSKGVVQSGGNIGDMVSVHLKSYNKTFRGKLNETKQVEVWL